MTFLAPDFNTVADTDRIVASQRSTGGLRRIASRLTQAFMQARQRQAERDFLRGNFHHVAKDTGIDSTTLHREAGKPFWRAYRSISTFHQSGAAFLKLCCFPGGIAEGSSRLAMVKEILS